MDMALPSWAKEAPEGAILVDETFGEHPNQRTFSINDPWPLHVYHLGGQIVLLWTEAGLLETITPETWKMLVALR